MKTVLWLSVASLLLSSIAMELHLPDVVRLVGGTSHCAGVLEMKHQEEWKPTYDPEWRLRSSSIVCRQLDCGSAVSTEKTNVSLVAPLWKIESSCVGSESSLGECVKTTQSKDDTVRVEVTCSESVRLVNGTSLCSGRVEVKSDQSWVSVCESDFDQQDAEVVCRQLGCGAPSVLQGALYGEVKATMWSKEFQCEGNESVLLDCRTSDSTRNTCSPDKTVGLTCSDLSKKEEIRIVLVGKTGVGKSAVGNTILGRQDLGRRAFVSKLASSSVTEECSKQAGQLKQDGQSGTVFVIDTPGLFGKEGTKETLDEIKRCISFSSPGPHVFLVVIQAGRFTPEESNAVNMIQITFGKQAQCYTMVLFTRGDDLEAEGTMIEDIISGTEGLNTFVKQCNGRYHVLNNRDKSPSQVTELLRKISEMVDLNGGSHYTNEMFQEAERAITEEMRKILLENPALSLEEARKRAEKDNSFIRKCAFVFVSSAIGGAIGGTIGAITGGPGGAKAGAALGVAAGGAAAGGAAATGSVPVGNYTDVYEKAIEGEIRMIRQQEPGLSVEEARQRAERDIRKSGLVVAGGVIGALRGAVGGAAAGLGGAATGAIRGALGGAREAAYVSDQCISQ